MTIDQVADALLVTATTFLADPPTRQFTTVGDIAVFPRCEQLAATIRAPQTSRGLGSASPTPVATCMVVPIWHVCIELWRCVPVPQADGSPPAVADLNASALTVSADMEDLFYGFVLDAVAGTLTAEGCTLSTLTTEVVGPTGGMVGFRVCVGFEMSRPTGSGS